MSQVSFFFLFHNIFLFFCTCVTLWLANITNIAHHNVTQVFSVKKTTLFFPSIVTRIFYNSPITWNYSLTLPSSHWHAHAPSFGSFGHAISFNNSISDPISSFPSFFYVFFYNSHSTPLVTLHFNLYIIGLNIRNFNIVNYCVIHSIFSQTSIP